MGGLIGDSAPLPLRKDFVNKHMKAGQVLYLPCSFFDPPKDKYLVMVCAGPDPLLIPINSRIRPYIEDRPDLKQCQVRISASDYSFLSYDSYIDCTRVIADFSEADIRDQLLSAIERVVESLTTATIGLIVAAVRKAPTISQRYKKRIIPSLSDNDS